MNPAITLGAPPAKPRPTDPQALEAFIQHKLTLKDAAVAAFKDFYVDDELMDRAEALADEVRAIGRRAALAKHDGLLVVLALGVLRHRLRIERKIDQTQPIGTFIATRGRLLVADPCHGGGVEIVGARRGVWTAHIVYREGWGIRCYGLMAANGCEIVIPVHVRDLTGWERVGIVGVDSGQAGIFDATRFRGGEGGWYDLICDLTGKRQAGVIDGGCVASSGNGDGGYEVFVRRDAGEVVAVWLDFIGVAPEERPQAEGQVAS